MLNSRRHPTNTGRGFGTARRNLGLIKSTDKGRTWTRDAAENYKRPMWPGARFGSPFYVHYEKNGGNVGQDGANRYIYAVSNNGFWNDGDQYIIGPRSQG